MIRLMLAAAFAALAMQASANTWRCGQSVVVVGDSTAALKQRCGQPDRVVQLETAYGGAAGERWEYDRRGVTTLITIRGGRIRAIEEAR